MTGRSVPTWQGKTPDSKVPPHVRARIFTRCDGKCHLTGRVIRAGEPWELEHIRPLSMGGAHAENNLAPALVAPHREKTAQEATDRAKADRIRLKHLGLVEKKPWPKRANPWNKRSTPLQGDQS